MNKQPFLKSLLPPIIVTVFLVGLFWSLLSNFDGHYKAVVYELDNAVDGNAIVLSADCDSAKLATIIFNNGYAEAEKDAGFIAGVLIKKQKEHGRLSSLFALQKRDLGQIPVAEVVDATGGLAARKRLSCELLGQNETAFEYQKDTTQTANGKMVVSVLSKDAGSSKKMNPCPEVRVDLTLHYRDTANNASVRPLGYVLTDSVGLAVFEGLDTEASYSVLPVKEGFEYGSSKGTVGGKWKFDRKGEMRFAFEQKEHRIPLFSNATLKRIKNDRTILVRSPKEYKTSLVRWFVYVLVAWWVLVLYMVFRKKRINGAMTASCMFLTGLSLLMMFSMQDPLNDEMIGPVMGQGVVIGLAACILLQHVDFVRFYQNNYKVGFDPLMGVLRWVLPKKFADRLPKGIGWALLAVLLTAMLWTPLGQSVGGMRVNLNLLGLKFQPSEIAKYLVLLFMAAFFTQQADVIIAYSQPKRIKLIGSKVKTLAWIIAGLAVLLAMYLALGDMGPGLVIGITFILLYSLVKSKVDLDNVSDSDRWRRIFSCDFAMLVYGVLSFAGFLLIGYCLGMMWLFGLLWFVAWIALGYFAFKKQLFESALLMNFVLFVFICGGQIMKGIPMLEDSSVVKRFEERTSMCVNPWGDLDVENHGASAKPVSNIQVANGLWALSTGGPWGQGMGSGRPSLIPAFHTDMILSSIGEQMGWIGLLLVVLAFVVLLRKMAVTGYQAGHPFAFYLCMSFAIVTGVQFFIIALGSSGMIPLTGVTVPFLSFGRVSMILNLVAFGVVLSLSSHVKAPESAVSQRVRHKTVERYSYPVAMITLVFVVFAIFTLLVWQYYQVWKRDQSLLHPAYVHNAQGEPLVEYNPRIKLVENNMFTGNLLDCKGRLLATSDKGLMGENRYLKRYYPYGNQLFFMVGDNTDFYYEYNENLPSGYYADKQERYLSYMRGFDAVLYDDQHNPIQVKLSSDSYRESSFLAPGAYVKTIDLKDYSPLLEYLKDGIDGTKLENHNKQVREGDFDLRLTVDAELQAALQNDMEAYMKNTFKNDKYFNLMRASVVVLDAKNGDLLASANYPLPDYNRLYEEEELAKAKGKHAVYNDNYRHGDWMTYTDRDLGTTRQTEPGSTAKLMSATAGFMELGIDANSIKYKVKGENVIERNKYGKPSEPSDDKSGTYYCDPVTMRDAIAYSSNCYFVHLVNDRKLYPQLEIVYSTLGIRIGSFTPYYYTRRGDESWEEGQFHELIDRNREVAERRYEVFKSNGYRGEMDYGEWKWAWGQGYDGFEILATPLNMARMASAVVNNGEMPTTQYVLEPSLRHEESVRLLDEDEAAILKGHMMAETRYHKEHRSYVDFSPNTVGGKTGTPERWHYYDPTKEHEKLNDGWYVFFVEREGRHPLAVAVRIERLAPKKTSVEAVKLSKKVVERLGVLNEINDE